MSTKLSEDALRTIGKWLNADMNRAVDNGANSVSMPDELVEIAAWLHETREAANHWIDDAGRLTWAMAHIDELNARMEEWRKLAMKFDSHRMVALWHLKILLDHPEKHAQVVKEFLMQSPEEVHNKVPWLGLTEDEIIETGNEVHRAMPDDADEQQELIEIAHELDKLLRSKNRG